MVVVLGLTGPLGSGKGMIADILSMIAGEHGIKVLRYSYSDDIGLEVQYRGLPQDNRDVYKETADAVRYRISRDAWAMLVISRIRDLLPDIEGPVLVIVDGSRTPYEVRRFRSEFGGHFRLIGVTASFDKINRNLRGRNRSSESKYLREDPAALELVLQSEMDSGESYSHDVASCLEMADWPPLVNDGSLEELEEEVRSLANQKILPLFQSRNSVAK